MKQSIRLVAFVFTLLLSLVIAGCRSGPFANVTPTINVTQAYETVQALVTQSGQDPLAFTTTPTALASPTPTLSLSALLTLTPIKLPTFTSVPPTPVPSPTSICDRAVAGNPIDVTIPDDTKTDPGQAFTKIWRLQNSGTCTWSRLYAARFFYGSQMGAPEIVYLAQDVPPGQTIDIAVDLVAPATPGAHQGNWKLANAEGQLFGIGPNGDAPFWVRVVVVPLDTPTPTLSPTASATLTPSPSPTMTPSPTSTPPVQAGGPLVLQLNQALNLDDGSLDTGEADDLVYQVDGGGFHVLVPQPGTLQGVFGLTQPGPEACQSASLGAAPIAFESLTPGSYLCYQTDQGLPGWLRYDSLDAATQSASLEFRTWTLAVQQVP